MSVHQVILNNGIRMPALGFGTMDTDKQAVADAIDAGYRHLDTALIYGNEPQVGKAITEKIAEGVIKREDIFVVTKLWGTFHEPHRVAEGCKLSLKRLGLQYVDLFLMHSPMSFRYRASKLIPDADADERDYTEVDYVETWKMMEGLVDKGLVKSIGLSNFNSQQVDRLLLSARIRPVVNQIECSPGISQSDFIAFLKKRDIVTIAYSPLGCPNPEKQKPIFLYDPHVEEIAWKYSKTPAQVILRYLIEIDVVPIPRSMRQTHIKENIQIFDFHLNSMEIEYMDSFDNHQRTFNNDIYKNHKHFPFGIEF